MSEILKYGRVLSLALVVGIGASACGGKKSAEVPTRQLCQAERPVDWLPTPPWLDIYMAAKDMGVSENEIINGGYGEAVCPAPVPEQEAYSASYIVSVPGEGDKCLVLEYSRAPQNDSSRRHVLVECAGAALPAHSTTSSTF